jgi:putative phage-type endonuclease
MTEPHLIQGSKEWLDMRKNCIGASDVPAILNISPWTTPYQLWTYKMGLAEPEMNSAMARGVAMEEEARQAFNIAHNVTVTPKVYFDDVYPWMMASLDGVSEDKKIVVEIKCPGIADHVIAVEGRIPDKYYPQLQHQLYVSGLRKMYYFSYRSPLDHKVIEVERDDEYIEKMLEKEKEFYRCMTEFDPPPLCDKDYIKRDDDYWASFAEDYKKAKQKRLEGEEEEKYYRHLLITCSGGKNCIGAGLQFTKYHRKGVIEYSKIPELEKVDLEQYRKPAVESYRITEVKDGDTVTTIS